MTIEKHCTWFPSLGTLDLQQWEKVGSELKKLHQKGVPTPISIWPTWSLIKSFLEPLPTQDESEESSDEKDDELGWKSPKYAIPKGTGKTVLEHEGQERYTYPSALQMEEEINWPPPRPLLSYKKDNKNEKMKQKR